MARETAPPPPCLPRPCRFPNRARKPPVPDTFTDQVEKAPAEPAPYDSCGGGAARTAQTQTSAGCVANTRQLNKTPDTLAEAELVAEEEVLKYSDPKNRLRLPHPDAALLEPAIARNVEDLIACVRRWHRTA